MSVAAAGPQIAGALSAGVDGLDDILAGGCPATGIYLVETQPGIGKTTLNLPLPRNGNARGECGPCNILFGFCGKVLAAAANHLPGTRADARR